MTSEGTPERVPISRVARLDFIPTKLFSGGAELHLARSDAQSLLADVGFAEPQHLEGGLLALPTGELSITYAAQDGTERVRTFDVLADELLRDREAPDFVYILGEELHAALPIRRRR